MYSRGWHNLPVGITFTLGPCPIDKNCRRGEGQVEVSEISTPKYDGKYKTVSYSKKGYKTGGPFPRETERTLVNDYRP